MLLFEGKFEITAEQHKLTDFHDGVLLHFELEISEVSFVKTNVKLENFHEGALFFFGFGKFESDVGFCTGFVHIQDHSLIDHFNLLINILYHLFRDLPLLIILKIIILHRLNILLQRLLQLLLKRIVVLLSRSLIVLLDLLRKLIRRIDH